MSATTNNQNPIFIKDALYAAPAGSTDFIGSGIGVVLTANTALDGTGSIGSTLILFATIPSSGAVLNKIILTHLGTNIATVVRVFINNGSSVATASNNRLFKEYAIAANTISQTATSVQIVDDFYDKGYRLAGGSVLYITTGTTIASGIQVQGFFDGLSN
jgi:hypothetical protein